MTANHLVGAHTMLGDLRETSPQDTVSGIEELQAAVCR